MMSYNVLVNKRILKASKHLPENHKKKLIEILDVLRTNPIPSERFDVKKLKGFKMFFESELVIIGLFMHCLKKKNYKDTKT